MNLSFSGCGFLGIYHCGVACCIQKYAPQLLLNKISGASAGALAASALLCHKPCEEMISQGLQICREAGRGFLGPFSPSFDMNQILAENLREFLPEDAHLRVNGKLHVSLTRVRDGKNVIISQFESKEDLIQAVITSTFIPVFSGFIPPKFRGVRYLDGGFSNNLPIIDEHTITVSPFCGETDICPKDDSYQLYNINLNNSSIELSQHNIYRFKSVLFPPQPEILAQMCRQGFEDTLRFLYRNNLLSCTRCLEIQSTFIIETEEDCTEYDPECLECKTHQLEILSSNMPEQVVRVFQDAIERANEGILNWIYKHQGLKMLSIVALPYLLPPAIMYASITKLVSVAPQVSSSIWEFGKHLFGQLSSVVIPQNTKSATKISLHLSVAEYDGKDNANKKPVQDVQANSKTDLNFIVNLHESDTSSRTEHPRRKFSTKKILSRTSSLIFSNTGEGDTFENILEVTTRQDALISYYYTDENNKMDVTKPYGITDSNSNIVSTTTERQINAHTDFISNISSRKDFDISPFKRAFQIGESEEYFSMQDQRPESDQ